MRITRTVFMTLFAICVLLSARPATAEPIRLVNAIGILTGATGVSIEGFLYRVDFLDGTCIAVFSGCDTPGDFAFHTAESGQAAAQALLDQVFLDTAQGAFDTNPALTNGCTFALACNLSIPTTLNVASGQLNVAGWGAQNAQGTDVLFQFASIRTRDLTTVADSTWAMFTPEESPAETPEPNPLVVVAASGLAVAAYRVRRRRRHAAPTLYS
jgi:hypothetical protein